MLTEEFISKGILLALSGTLAAGGIGILGNGRWGHRISNAILACSTAVGAIASLGYLLGNRIPMTIVHLPFLKASLTMDALSALFLLMVTFIGCMSAIYAIQYLEESHGMYHVPSLNLLTALFMVGMETVLLASGPLSFLFFWETMSIASFFLVMADRKEVSIRAAFLYLVMTQLGAFAILAGFAVMSGGMPFVSFGDFSQEMSTQRSLLAAILFFIGFGSKAGLMPLHIWLPEAHPQAPSHISALMSGVMLKIAVYGFMRTVLDLLPSLPLAFDIGVIAIGLVSAIGGVLPAVIERDIKRTLAWSSIENMGLLFTMLGVALFAEHQGLTVLREVVFAAALVHAVSHALFKSGLFLSAGILVHAAHSRSLEAMGGFAKRMPLFSGAFCMLALAAAALPPFSTFVGEWMFLQGVVEALSQGGDTGVQGVLVIVFLITVLVSGLAVFAMVKLFGISCLGEPRTQSSARAERPSALLTLPIGILAILVVAVGGIAPFFLRGTMRGMRSVFPEVVLSGDSLSPALLLISLVLVVLLMLLAMQLLVRRRVRLSHTWDCGQPITSGMEYTATAFSAPIRFFFRYILHTRKSVKAVPLVSTNPWICARTMALTVRPNIFPACYEGVGRLFQWMSMGVKRIQNGAIQFYLLLMFLTLILSLAFAL